MSINYIKCSVCGKIYYNSCVRKCPHGAVNKVYGENVCLYCCRKCKHHIYEFIGEGCELLDKIRVEKQNKKPKSKPINCEQIELETR